MLRADLHVHSLYSHDSGASLQSLIAWANRTGINCIALTDHNTIEGALEFQTIAPFKVIVGDEIRSAGGDIIGLFLKAAVPPRLTPKETAEAIKAQGGLVLAPHPFDHVRPSALTARAFEELLPFIDIIEVFNARNLFHADDRRAAEASQRHNLTPAVVSDAHTARELGRNYQEMPDFDGTPQGLMASLKQSTLVYKKTRIVLRLAPTYAKIRKKLRWI
ncbi:MAG: PHP domain-containing protein [SAR202 cluster bacterium]|nr:PHP domain-containing protein [SAR202 cluster bacterium]